jgi:Family of unknown function (DUF6152)
MLKTVVLSVSTRRGLGRPVHLAVASLAFVAASGAPPTVSAHHSVAGQFDSSQRFEITGTVSEVEWINPHIYIHVDVKNEQGAVTTWRLESLPTAMLRKAGLTKEMIVADGMPVTVSGFPARDGTKNLGWVLKLTYADGHYYQLAGE